MELLAFLKLLYNNNFMLMATILTLGVIFVNGWTDAPNAIATCVTTRCMGIKSAIIMSAMLNLLGVLIMTLLNPSVAQTITKMVDFSSNSKAASIALVAALFSVVAWALLAWCFSIPTSESHALIAGLTGSAIATSGGLAGVNMGEWQKVFLGLVLSLTLGLILGIIICSGVIKLFYNINRNKSELFFKYAGLVAAAFTSFMHGAQDGQKFMAVIALSIFLTKGEETPSTLSLPVWLMLLCGVLMMLGTLVGGKKIIKSVGSDMVPLQKYQGFSADIASSFTLLFCSLLGFPVSTTHAKTAAIVGVGAAVKIKSLNFKVVFNLILTWVFTFPCCGLISYLATLLLLLFAK